MIKNHFQLILTAILLILCNITLIALDETPNVNNINSVERKATEGEPKAQYELAERYFDGKIVEKDYRKFLYWLEKSSDQGFPEAQTWLGQLYESGFDGINQDYIKAFELFTKAAAQGDSDADFALAGMYHTGKGVKENKAKALELYRKASENGIPTATYFIGEFYKNGYVVLKDDKKAAELYKRASDEGEFNATIALAEMYENGTGVQKNKDKAQELYIQVNAEYPDVLSLFKRLNKKTGKFVDRIKYGDDDHGLPVEDVDEFQYYLEKAETGEADAQYKIGSMYEFGKGTRKNGEKASEWYKKAAAQGHALSQAVAGYPNIESKDDEFEKNASAWYDNVVEKRGNRKFTKAEVQNAIDYFKKSADNGDALGQYCLAKIYYHGYGAAKNMQKAFELFSLVAKQNFHPAQFYLGLMYQKGEGIVKNEMEAYKWYLLAQAGGINEAKHNAEIIEKKMSRAEIYEGQQNASAFSPKK